MRAWSLITLGEDRQYGGNRGYEDDPERAYLYDSRVANHKRVSAGDVAILRNRTVAFGVALVSDVSVSQGMKQVRKCPECHTSSIKIRKLSFNPWRCRNNHQFLKPSEVEEEVTKYEARYDHTYSRFKKNIDVSAIKSIALRPSDQLSIEELGIEGLERLLSKDRKAVEILRTAIVLQRPIIEGDDVSKVMDFIPTMSDQRKSVLRSIKERRGQAKFRNSLIERYGDRCMVSGCKVLDALEAAHIVPYLGEQYNHPSNGLLLRADIHTLFDLQLMGIEPGTHKIIFHPDALKGEYAGFHGANIELGKLRPSNTCLKLRWKGFVGLNCDPN